MTINAAMNLKELAVITTIITFHAIIGVTTLRYSPAPVNENITY